MLSVPADPDKVSSFRAAGKQPEIIVHEHCGESGAIGAGVEALRLWRNGMRTTFIGLDAVRKIEYRTTRNEDTRCNFCKNTCLRTFIDIKMDTLLPLPVTPAKKKVSKVPFAIDEQRLIIATCEKGTVEDVNDMKGIRVETIDYFLRRYREQIIKRRKAEGEINAQLVRLEGELRQQATEQRQEGGLKHSFSGTNTGGLPTHRGRTTLGIYRRFFSRVSKIAFSGNEGEN